MARIIIHVDMNAFFASVEKILHPELKDKPVAVGGKTSRSIITTACYIARQYGIKSAMPTYKARRLCPELVIMGSGMKVYAEYRDKFLKIIEQYTKKIEVASIDECYADLSEYDFKQKNPIEIIKQIQMRIFNEIGLPCSVGVAPNKFLAKMASDYKKPMGLTVIRLRDVKKILWPLPIGEMYGIGRKTAPRLIENGFMTIGDLAQTTSDDIKLKKILGINTQYIINLANGIDNSELILEKEQCKSISHSHTLDEDTDDYEFLIKNIKNMGIQVAKRAQKYRLVGLSVGIVVKYHDFSIMNRSKMLKEPTNNEQKLIKIAIDLFEKNYNGEKVRLVGVKLDRIVDKEVIFIQPQINLQTNMFTSNVDQTQEIIDEINCKVKGAKLKKANE